MIEITNFHDSVIMAIPGISYINREIVLSGVSAVHRFFSQ